MALIHGIGDEILYVLFLFGLLFVVIYYLFIFKERRREERATDNLNDRSEYDRTREPGGSSPEVSEERLTGLGTTGGPEQDVIEDSGMRRRLNVSSGVREGNSRSNEVDPSSSSIWGAARTHITKDDTVRSSGYDNSPLEQGQQDRPSLEQDRERPSLEQDRERPSLEQDRERSSMEQDRERPSLEQDRERPSLEQDRERPSLEQDQQERYLLGDALRIRLIHLQQRLSIVCSPDSTLQELARVHFPAEVAAGRRIRYIYRGQLLPADRTLREQRIANDEAIHIHISPHNQEQQQPTGEAVLDISGLFPLLLGVILVIVWAVLITKPSLFVFSTKIMLYFLSFGYLLVLYAQIVRLHFVQT